MKKLLLLSIYLMVMAGLVTACEQSEFEKTAYKTIKSAQITYDAGMRASRSALDDGVITQEQYAEIVKMANPVYATLKSSALALLAYHDANEADKKSAVIKELSLLAANLGTMMDIVERYVTTFKRTE